MHMPKQTITLDVSRRNSRPPRVFLGSGDHLGTLLEVNVVEDGRPFDCAGLTPYLMVGWGGSTRIEGEAVGNVASIPIDESSAFGTWHGTTGNAYVSLESEDMVTSTQRFTIHVAPSAIPPEEPADPTDPEGPTEPEEPVEPEEPTEPIDTDPVDDF